MTMFQPADHLHSRTFLGLLVAQFLAAFNDQAIHASAMFFAINTGTMTESRAISLMPILFYAPWAIFCTVAGYLADRYSKRVSLVAWKLVEVLITLFALYGFWLGRHGHPVGGSYVVLSTVFLMGMHSAFFVPAKYGAMPEILTPRMISKGNGWLESLSFIAVISGTVVGGVLSSVYRGEEYMIGVILTVLALVGAVASLAIESMPAANPTRSFPAYVFQPLVKNIRELLTSRPLLFAAVGIAFFTFLVAYMRQVVYMHGQSQLPPWSEMKTSIIVGMVALGIGIGSPLVGNLSGGKVEIGLVPIGAVGMVLATTAAAMSLSSMPVLITAIVCIGFFTGFYLVPLFSLLQHRAPKASKGDSIATSNFLNITGAIAASLLFFAIDRTAERSGFTPPLPLIEEGWYEWTGTMTAPPESEQGHVVRVWIDDEEITASDESPYRIFRLDKGVGEGVEVVLRRYGTRDVTYYVVQPQDADPVPIYNKERLPSLLFLSAGAMTFLTLGLLWFLQPDLFGRTLFWLRTRFKQKLEVAGLLRLPGSGAAIVATDADGAAALRAVANAGDRVEWLADARSPDPEAVLRQARRALLRGGVVEVCVFGDETLLGPLLADASAPVLPVHYLERVEAGKLEVYVVAGSLLAPGAPAEVVREELRRLREDLAYRLATGAPLEKDHAGGH